jgi:hypothetical protein
MLPLASRANPIHAALAGIKCVRIALMLTTHH